jgi:hypothetical protein
MISRERGNIWPLISVATGAFFVLVITPLIVQRQRNGRMATVDAQVSIGDEGSNEVRSRSAPAYRWPDSEVSRTAERLRDVSAVAIASITYVVEGAMTGRTPSDAGEIVAGITKRQLIPDEWLTNQTGVLQLPHGTIHLRYSPKKLSVELISVPNDRADGPAILIRIPDDENTAVGARYFESMQIDGIIYPNPFTPLPDIIAAGWRPRLFKQTQIPEQQRAQLERWAQTAIRK